MSILKLLHNLFSINPPVILARNLDSVTEDKISAGWQRVSEMVKASSPSSLRQAVVEADKIFDAALKYLVQGEMMGERLKNAKELFRDRDVYQGVWEAHKVRNALVHEESYEPPYYVTKEMVEKFKVGLEALGVKF